MQGPDFRVRQFDHVSPEAKDFCRKLMSYQSRRRPTGVAAGPQKRGACVRPMLLAWHFSVEWNQNLPLPREHDCLEKVSGVSVFIF